MPVSQACDRYNCGNCRLPEQCKGKDGCSWLAWCGECLPSWAPELSDPQSTQVPTSTPPRLWHEVRTDSFVSVTISIVDELLSIHHNDHAYASYLHIPGWTQMAQARPWHLVFGARTGTRVDDHWIRDVNIVQGALVDSAAILVSLRGSGESEACRASAQFHYYAPPVVSRLSTTQGPIHGGTPINVHTTHLARHAPHHSCQFGQSRVDGTRLSDFMITCMAPAHDDVGAVEVAASLNGVDFTSDPLERALYHYTNPIITTLTPNATSSREGATLMTINGEGLGGGTHYRCRFGDLFNVAAHFSADTGSILCAMPPLEGGNSSVALHVDVALNGIDFTNSNMTLVHVLPPVIGMVRPAMGPATGRTRVMLQGRFVESARWVRKMPFAALPFAALPLAARFVHIPLTCGFGACAWCVTGVSLWPSSSGSHICGRI